MRCYLLPLSKEFVGSICLKKLLANASNLFPTQRVSTALSAMEAYKYLVGI